MTTDSKFVMQKHWTRYALVMTLSSWWLCREHTYVMMKTNPIVPFNMIVNMIAFRTDWLASIVASAMFTAVSEPTKEPVAASVPIKYAVLMLGQPPKFSNEPKTSLAGAFDANTHRGMTMQKKPKMCTTSTRPWRFVRRPAPYVFVSVPMMPMPIISSD
jgi:hypothetical protein